MATSKKAGRKPINDSDDVAGIQLKIDDYFNRCEELEHRPTYCGLAYHLGYSSRQSLWENAISDKPISLPIKRAMLLIEGTYERMLGNSSPTGAIFALKNRGWADKQEVELSGREGSPIKFQFVDPPNAASE